MIRIGLSTSTAFACVGRGDFGVCIVELCGSVECRRVVGGILLVWTRGALMVR